MIELGPFTREQYEAWVPGSIADYASEHVKSGRWSAEEAAAKAREEFTTLLPQGIETPAHQFFSIVRSSDRAAVGMIWIQRGRTPGRAFIFNLEIFKPYRRKGYAEEAMRALESEVRRMGDSAIGLHVFGDNAPARSLYKKLGYTETNVNMVKRL